MSCLGDDLPDYWYRDKDLFVRELAAHGDNDADVCRAHGLRAPSLLSKWRTRHGLPKKSPGGKQQPLVVVAEQPDDAWLLAALKKRGDNASVEDLADFADVAPRKVRDALARLGHDGYRVIEEEGQRVVLHRTPPPSDNQHRLLFAGETVRFGVVSDTHLGSKHERLEELHHAYKVFEDEGITEVFHPGDLVCGYGIFPGQANEVNLHTYTDQVDYAVANYPKIAGITTRLIGGNHDLEGAWGKAGANPCVAVANQRPDIDYLGDYRATVELQQGTRIYLLHPKGGIGYAADYKVRKLVEGFEGGAKPQVMLIGHYHRRFDVEARGVHCLLSGCFESGGSFGVRLGLSDPAVGFHICEMTVADDGSVVKWTPSWYRFWPGRGLAKAA
jgi:predicted phosphodiesterase